MTSGLSERTNNFNLRRFADTREIFATYELGSQIVGKVDLVGSAILGNDIKGVGKRILETLKFVKSEGIFVDNLETTIDSIQSQTDLERRLEPLSQEELNQLVNQLSQEGDFFHEGASMSVSGNLGKERK